MDDLLKKRRQWKAAVTRHCNSMDRHLAERNEERVRTRLDQLKNSFTSFEEAHEAYHTLLENDDQVDISDTYFFDQEKLYTEAVRKAMEFLDSKEEPKEVKEPVNRANDSILNATGSSEIMMYMNMPRQEIEKYDGDPTKYHIFMSMFEENVKCVKDNKLKLNHLINSMTGRAHDAIKACALMSADMGYEEARKILLERYGNDYLVSERMINDIRNGKQVHTPEGIQTLADELSQCYLVLKQMGKAAEIESQRCISEIVDRLPKYIRDRWRRQAQDIKDERNRFPCFEEFMKFVSKEARYSNCPVYGEKSRSPSNQFSQASLPKTKTTSSFSTSTKDRKPRICPLCAEDHNLIFCKHFKELKYSQQVQLVHEKQLCEVCLRSNHKTSDCNSSYVCPKNGCGKRHSIFLHDDSAPQGTYEVQLVNANVCVDRDVHMPIVGIRVNNTHEVCALLDSASSTTFCSKSLIESLGVRGIIQFEYH